MWYEIQNAADRAIIRLFGDIGLDISASQFVAQLDALGNVDLELRINSIGGSVTEGFAIYNRLLAHKGGVDVFIDGIAASMASVIAMAGRTITMARESLFMIHNPQTIAQGDQHDMEHVAGTLQKMADLAIAAYQRHTKLSAKKIAELMNDETWFTADEALAAGFIDQIDDTDLDIAACARDFDLSQFTNIPQRFKEKPHMDDDKPTFDDGVKAERERVAAINLSFRRHPEFSTLAAQCIADGLSLADANAKLLAKLGEGAEPINPTGRHVYAPDDFRLAAVDAILMRSGLTVKKPHPGARDVISMSARDIARTVLSRTGASVAGISDSKLFKMSLTTSDFPAILVDAANKALRMGMEAEASSHNAWVHKTEARDFKKLHRPLLGSMDDLLPVEEGAEYQYSGPLEDDEGFAVAKYGRAIRFTWESFVNDDLQAFSVIPRAFAMAAQRKEADVVYTVFTANSAAGQTMNDSVTLFHADHGNLTSSGTFDVTLLGAGRALMRKQKSLGGGYLNLTPRFLIVRPDEETKAEQLIASSSRVISSSSEADTPQWVSALELVVEPRLTAAAAYLAADWNVIDTVEVATLADHPTVLEDDEFTVDARQFKCRHVFGARCLDYRGLVKMPISG